MNNNKSPGNDDLSKEFYICFFEKLADPLIQALTLFHMGGGGGGGADSALLQIVFFITSVKDAAEPRNLVTFPKI